jgi:chemosensory pili system protein ChpA (sensor histidine kinase/response regulator)
MSAARTDWQAILASFADEIQPLLAVVASSLDRLVEQPHDALAATTGLAQLQTLQASASLMAVEGFEALLETTRAALQTVIGGGPLSPHQQAAGRELGDLLLREGEAIGQGECTPAPPPRAAELLLIMRAVTAAGAAPVAPSRGAQAAGATTRAATNGTTTGPSDLESWLDTLMLAPAPDAELASPTPEPIAADPDDTDELPRQTDLLAGKAKSVVADAASPSVEEPAPAATWTDEPVLSSEALASDAPLADPEMAALPTDLPPAEPAAAESDLATLLAALEEVAGEPVAANAPVEATVAWQSSDDATLEMAPIDLDAALSTLGPDAPSTPTEPDFAFAATTGVGESEAAPEMAPDLVAEVVADELSAADVDVLSARPICAQAPVNGTAEASPAAEPDSAGSSADGALAELLAGLREVTGEPLSEADRAELTTAWHEEIPEAATMPPLAAETAATDDSLTTVEAALAFDELLSTLDADDEPLLAAALAADVAAEPVVLPQRVAITMFMTKWADALEADAGLLDRSAPGAADTIALATEPGDAAVPLPTHPAEALPFGEAAPPADGVGWLSEKAEDEPPADSALAPLAHDPSAEPEPVADPAELVALPAPLAAEVVALPADAAAEADLPADDQELADLLDTLDAGGDAAALDRAVAPAAAADDSVAGFCEPTEIELYLSEPGSRVAAWAAEPAAARARPTPAGADEPEALAVFATECVRLVEAVADARAALEAAPDDEMALTDLTWATHTLRGAASLVGADAISQVCGFVERALEQFATCPLPLAPDSLTFLATAEAVLRELQGTPAGPEDMVALVAAQYEALHATGDEAPSAPVSEGWGDLPPELAAQLDGVDVTELDEATLAQLAEALAAHDAARGATSPPASGTEPPAPVALPELIGDDLPSPWALPTDLGDAPLADPLGFAGDAEFEAELRATFLGEAEEHLSTINGALLALESNPGDAARLIAVRRAVHTLKSASGVVGLEAVSSFCHVWEDALECVEEETGASPPELSLLLECAEALERYFAGVSADSPAAEAAFAPLVERLREAAGEVPAAAPGASMAPNHATDEPWTGPTSGVVFGVAAQADSERAAFGEVEPTDEAEVLAPAAQASTDPRASAEMLRVPLGRVDGMIDLVGELVLQRSGLVQRLEALRLGVDDLAPSLERLRRLGVDLEDRFAASDEARSLARRQGSATGSAAEFDELEFDRYNAANLLARELSELAADLATTRRELGHLVEDARLALTRQGRVTSDLHDDLLDARLVPLSQLTLRLQRTVRQVALKSGKEVTFSLEGGETLLDKTLLEQIADPLLHLLRNAVDHGIEPADQRVARGKSPTGSVRVVAGRDGHEVVIQVCDDGAGIDTARVLAQARAKGLIGDETADAALAHELIFAPGLSTSSTLTDLSGRGIGLDAVRAHLARAKGTIAVSSTLGEGTVFTLRLPSLLVVTPSLVVAAHGQRLALPLAQVRHVLRVPHEQVLIVGDTRMVPLDGSNVRIRALGDLLGWPSLDDEPRATVLLVVVAVGERQVALEVDDVFGQQETVVKTPAPPFDVLPGLAGASVQGNGEVLLVLNLLELVAEPGGRPRGVPLPPPPAGVLEPPTVLVVDDSLSVRRVVVRALERHGWRAYEARDGVHALEVLRRVSPDVVLLDIEMPRMDGYELAGILKKQDTFQGIPIVMLTSRGGEKHRRKAFDLGVDAYLVKPYQEAELLRILRQVALAVPEVVA